MQQKYLDGSKISWKKKIIIEKKKIPSKIKPLPNEREV